MGWAVGGIVLAASLCLIFGYFVMLLWNWLMPAIFGLKEITYWQAAGLVILARLLFGSYGHGKHGHHSPQGHGHDKDHHCYAEWGDRRYYDRWWEKEGKQGLRAYVEQLQKEKAAEDR